MKIFKKSELFLYVSKSDLAIHLKLSLALSCTNCTNI